MNDPWFQAVEEGNTEEVVRLLGEGADVDAPRDSVGYTALFIAIMKGHHGVIKALLEHGASPDVVTSLGDSPISSAYMMSRNDWGGFCKPPRLDPIPFEMLMAAGARYGLRDAILLNDIDLVRVRLDEGVDPDTGRGSYHGPFLMFAAQLGHVDIVNLLLDRGADIEATDDLGQRPLLSAAQLGRAEAVSCLLERGAEINAVDWSGQSALALAAEEGHHDLVRLLMDHGAVLRDVDYNEHTLLAEVARLGHLDVVRLLIERGADLHAVGTEGLTPLALAKKEGRGEVVDLLVGAGALH